MKVPGTPGPIAQGAPQAQIPPEYLMMAAAQMQKEQQTKLAGDVIPFPGPSIFESATRRMGGTVIKNPYPPSSETMRKGLQDLIDAGRISITPKDK